MKLIPITAAWMISALLLDAQVQVDFSHSYTGAGSATQNTGTLTLSFTCDASGNVTLDASCDQAGPAVYVDEFDGAVGTVTNPAMWGQTFTITLTGAGSPGNLRVDNSGGGLAIQGGNAQRLDWAVESISAAVDVVSSDFVLLDVSYVNATTSAGTEMVVAGTGYALSGSTGLVDVSAQGVSNSFVISSDTDTDGQGFVLSGLTFDLIAAPITYIDFDNDSGDDLWATTSNWDNDVLPIAPTDARIAGFDVMLDSAVASGPNELLLENGSLTVSASGSISVNSMVIGRDLSARTRLITEGATASLNYGGASNSDVFAVGSAATIETVPDNSGSGALELGVANLTLDLGSQWILDGSQFSGTYTVGDQFVLANYGSLSGSTMGVRTRNFNLPADRTLQLVVGPTSLYYEVVAQVAATGPNIIIVNVDDMVGGEHFGFEGRDCLTPTIDGLAAGGIHYTQAFAASTVCGPSRYSLLTGRWASRNTSAHYLSKYPLGTLGRFAVSDTELETDGQNIGAWLQQAGYRTGFVGKAHVIDDDLLAVANWPAKGLITYSKTVDPALDSTVNGAMQHNHRVVAQRLREYGYDFVSGFYRANLLELRSDALNVHNQEWITKNALDFIDENHSQRFFLYMAPTINHGPVRNDLSKSLLADPNYTSAGYLPNEDYSFMPTRQSIVDEVVAGNKDLISARETWIDYSIKAITDKLTAHGIRNDTLIIFTADHGEKTLSGPLYWGKSSLYDTGMRVPLVMNWPAGISSPGRTYDESVSQVDFVPTLLELAGASALPTRSLDGESLVPVLNGSNASLRDEVFCEIGYARGVRTANWKYVAVRYTPSVYTQIDNGFLWQNHNTGLFTEPRPYYVNNASLGSLAQGTHPGYYDDDQLYDLSVDPLEQNNLYGQHPDIAYDLKKRLAVYLGDIPNRPFRSFNDSSTEFSPAPSAAPGAPTNLQMQFLDQNSLQLDWTDASNDELGFIIEQSEGGAPFEVVSENASGSDSAMVTVNPAVEDVVLRVSAYNSMGDSAAAGEIDLLSPNNWRFREFGGVDPELDDPISQWFFDADGDGLATIWEYAYATKPLDASSVVRPEGNIVDENGMRFLEYKVPRDSGRDVDIAGSVSLGFSVWKTGEPDCLLVEDEPDYLLFRSATPVGDETKQFIRAEILEP